MKIRIYIVTIIILIINSCSYPEILRDELIYENDFEDKNLNFIDGGRVSIYNNTTVIGDFNNDGFTLHLSDVDEHDYFVSFDLYIHGSWDGNLNGFEINDRPDKWILSINQGWIYIKILLSTSLLQHFQTVRVGQIIVLDSHIRTII